MEAIDLKAAQQRLEEKRATLASSRPTDPAQIGSVLGQTDVRPCRVCGVDVVVLDPLFSNFPGHKPTCEACLETEATARLEFEEKERKEKEHRDRVTRQHRIERNLAQCAIGSRFKGMTFDDYKPTNDKAHGVLCACREYVARFQPATGASLLMVGACGTGKNMLSAIIGQEVIKGDFSFLHTTALKLVRRVKESWRRDSEETEQQAVDHFTVPDLLVIDEIGMQFGSPTEQLLINDVINDRYENMRPTILISNLTLKQLEEVLGQRVVDRFHEKPSKMLVFDWESYRRR